MHANVGKTMKKWLLTLFFPALCFAVQDPRTIFQVSTFSALMAGVYEGKYRYIDLFDKGDFGLGTFNNIDGEMVALDGKFYRDSASGILKLVQPTDTTPFATVIFFNPQPAIKVKYQKSLDRLTSFLQSKIEKKNTPYAVRINGDFRYLKLRSLRKQTAPFKPLLEAVKEQYEYELTEIEGTLVGFWFPEYLNGVNIGGFYFHFIDSQRKSGGHVLDVSIKKGNCYFDPCEKLEVFFPNLEVFNEANLIENTQHIQAVENQSQQR